MPFAGGQPVLACGTADLWLAMPGTAATRLLVSTDQGETWRAAGSVPGAVSALAITGAGTGYAVTGIGRDEALWSVSEGGSEAAPVPLPSWVAKLAAAGAA